jgi:hypothetical protein
MVRGLKRGWVLNRGNTVVQSNFQFWSQQNMKEIAHPLTIINIYCSRLSCTAGTFSTSLSSEYGSSEILSESSAKNTM